MNIKFSPEIFPCVSIKHDPGIQFDDDLHLNRLEKTLENSF